MSRKQIWTRATWPALLALLQLAAAIAMGAPTVWTGPTVMRSDVTGPDQITPSVRITRGSFQGIFNSAQEITFTAFFSPADTEWADGTTANYASLTYTDWNTWAKNLHGGPPSTVGIDAVLHLKTDDIYIDIKFLSWVLGDPYSYQRSTPPAPNVPPTVSITSPTNGAAFSVPANVTIMADAMDSDGSVTNVEFFDGATSLGNDTMFPFSVTVPLSLGSHVLSAVAKDSNGAATTSSNITISVNSVPIPNPIPERIAKGDITIELQTIADGMASPLGLGAPDDGSGRLFVYDQAGPIWVVTPSGRLGTPLLDVRARLNPNAKFDYDERGLLGMATHPNFSQNPFIYTYTSETNAGAADFPATGTNRNHQSVITEWRIDAANSNRVDVASRREILRIDQPQSNHNGGTMRFGPDGFLYITLGDGGQANDLGDGHAPGGNAQTNMSILGKVIRIDVNGSNSVNGKYGIPASNPFDGMNGLREIYAYGLRNPFSFSFDRMTGEIYLADVGQNRVEEIDLIVSGGNYGWNIKEGTFWFDPAANVVVTEPVRPVPPGLIDPIAQYDHDDGLAIIGGFVYRGSQFPALVGRYVFADWGAFNAPAGRLYYLDTGNVIKEFRIGLTDRPLGLWVKGFGEGADGEIYVFGSRVVGPAGNTGKMLKIVPGPAPLSIAVPVVSNATEVICGWMGGRGPFAVQEKFSIDDPTWMNMAVSTQRTAAFSSPNRAGFFRIADTANLPSIPLSAHLTGFAERPTPLTNSATGFGLFSLDGNTLSFSIRYAGLSGIANAAHIHGPAFTTNAAPIIIDLAPYNGGAYGSNGAVSGTVVLTDAQKAMILGGRTYVNFHTASHPPGELRGQIAPVLMQAALRDAYERPNPVDTGASGLAVLSLVGDQLAFNVTYHGLSGPAFAAHIHGAASLATTAGILVDLQPYNGGAFGSSGTLGGVVTLTPDQIAAVVDGRTYINLHTTAHMPGELRGQIVPNTTAIPYTAAITGLAELPTPITNSAAGSAFFSLDGNRLTFSIRYSGLSGPATAAHIHGGANSSQSAGIQIDLAPYNGGAYGSSGAVAGTVLLTPAQRDMVTSARSYVNFHTAANPAGEMRGQIAPVLMQAYLSGASERPNPIFSPGTGLGLFALVLNRLSFDITYGRLPTSANAAHIHGPASISQSAGILIDLGPFNGGAFGTSGKLGGTVTLTTAHMTNIVDQVTYVNVHTGANPGGEIRGQVVR